MDWDADAFQVLKTIIRLGGIRPGLSFRGRRTTIYGGRPAVCATEMPLYALATYARQRSSAGDVSAYGIAFLKSEFHAAGGRPAIYGLSTDDVAYACDDPERRIFDESVLPLREQFRYVAHDPGGTSRWIDWSHEREWRWVARDGGLDEIWAKDHFGMTGPVPALPLFRGTSEGRPFTRVCVIVWSSDEAREIRELLTGFYLAGENNYGTPFDRDLIGQSRIIVLEDVIAAVESGGDLDAQTIEGLDAARLLSPVTITTPPADAEVVIARALEAAGAAATEAAAAFDADASDAFTGFGFAHAVTTEVTNPIIQHMLMTGRARGPFDGTVWIRYPGEAASSGLTRAEAICAAAAAALSDELGVSVRVMTRWD